MIEAGRISETDADAVQQQYTVFTDEVIKQSCQFATFNPTGSSTRQRRRVDSLFYDTMSQNQSCKQLWTVVKQLCLLSHGQATVECGFSVNKEMEVDNMAGSTFAAKRMVCDHVQSVGGINHVDVGNKQLLLYCASARHKYAAYFFAKYCTTNYTLFTRTCLNDLIMYILCVLDNITKISYPKLAILTIDIS